MEGNMHQARSSRYMQYEAIDFYMLPPCWSCSSYRQTIMNAIIIIFANRNQTILLIQPRYGNIDINGWNSRWLHHDKGLLNRLLALHLSKPGVTLKRCNVDEIVDSQNQIIAHPPTTTSATMQYKTPSKDVIASNKQSCLFQLLRSKWVFIWGSSSAI